MKETIVNAVKIMLMVVVVAVFLFLLCTGGGRLSIIFDLLISPVIWVFTFPLVGPIIFVITGVVVYGVLALNPSLEWKKNERTVSILVLLGTVGGFLASSEHAGLMFILACLVGVSYPIIQIVRFEVKKDKAVMKILS